MNWAPELSTNFSIVLGRRLTRAMLFVVMSKKTRGNRLLAAAIIALLRKVTHSTAESSSATGVLEKRHLQRHDGSKGKKFQEGSLLSRDWNKNRLPCRRLELTQAEEQGFETQRCFS